MPAQKWSADEDALLVETIIRIKEDPEIINRNEEDGEEEGEEDEDGEEEGEEEEDGEDDDEEDGEDDKLPPGSWAYAEGELQQALGVNRTGKARHRYALLKYGQMEVDSRLAASMRVNYCHACRQPAKGHICGRPDLWGFWRTDDAAPRPSTSGASARATARPTARPTTPTRHAWNGQRASLRNDVPQSPPKAPGSPENFGDAPLEAAADDESPAKKQKTHAVPALTLQQAAARDAAIAGVEESYRAVLAHREVEAASSAATDNTPSPPASRPITPVPMTPTAAAGRAPAPLAAARASPAFNGQSAAPSAGTLVDDDGAATHDPPEEAPEPAKAADGEADVDAEAESVGDTGAEAPMPVITVQDVKNRPSPPHEPFAEQARGAPIEDQFEQYWNATETSKTHFYYAGTWHPTWV
jgi:hypothetical protein